MPKGDKKKRRRSQHDETDGPEPVAHGPLETEAQVPRIVDDVTDTILPRRKKLPKTVLTGIKSQPADGKESAPDETSVPVPPDTEEARSQKPPDTVPIKSGGTRLAAIVHRVQESGTAVHLVSEKGENVAAVISWSMFQRIRKEALEENFQSEPAGIEPAHSHLELLSKDMLKRSQKKSGKKAGNKECKTKPEMPRKKAKRKKKS